MTRGFRPARRSESKRRAWRDFRNVMFMTARVWNSQGLCGATWAPVMRNFRLLGLSRLLWANATAWCNSHAGSFPPSPSTWLRERTKT